MQTHVNIEKLIQKTKKQNFFFRMKTIPEIKTS